MESSPWETDDSKKKWKSEIYWIRMITPIIAAKSKGTDTSKVLLWKEIKVEVLQSVEIHTIPYTNQ